MGKTTPEKQKQYNDIYYKKHYKENVQYYLNRNKKRRERLKIRFQPYKDKPCMDCGIKYPLCVMDFDHRDRKDKIDLVSVMINQGVGEKKILAEIQKCDVVCSNCHRLRTFKKHSRFF